MKNNESLKKFANNKKLLFFVPHFIYISDLLHKFYENKEYFIFENILILIFILFVLTTAIYLILKKIIKNPQNIFYILTFLCILYTNKYDLTFLLQLALYSVLIFFSLSVFRRIKPNSFDTVISISLLCIISYFLIGITNTTYSFIRLKGKQEKYTESFEFNVENSLSTPNIYWIHCDGMMNFDDINKYFHYNNKALLNYLNEEGYYVNEDASLVAGHKTQKALAALFNPNYYDNLLGKYLIELEDVYLEKTPETSFTLSTKEVVNKRFENELMTALKKKKYTTIGISKFNNHSSLKTDVYYDFYNYPPNHWHFTDIQELRKISDKSNKNIELSYRIVQLKEVLAYSVFSSLIRDLIPYNYELIDYNNIDTSNYPTIDTTSYWQIKAILKSIEESHKIDSNKFFFINYDLSHMEIAFDKDGNKLEKKDYNNLNKYVGNYIYTSKLLMEMLDYIKDNDENAVIILQADHGIHTLNEEYFKDSLSINTEQAQEIKNSVMNAVYIPKKYQNGDEKYLSNPLNISRYLVNNYVGKNYEYLDN